MSPTFGGSTIVDPERGMSTPSTLSAVKLATLAWESTFMGVTAF
jgi:hypothetical protein